MLQSSEAHFHMDYELVNQLGKVYRIQKEGVESTKEKIISEIFSSKSLFIPAESEALLYLTAWSFREISGQEQYLIRATEVTLEKLITAYPFLQRISEN